MNTIDRTYSFTDLLRLRAASLLHDIGRPLSWANAEVETNEIVQTFKLVSKIFGEDVGRLATRSQTGHNSNTGNQTLDDLQWLIAVSHTIASGDDDEHAQKAEADSNSPRSFPIRRSHLLSGELVDSVDRTEIELFFRALESEFASTKLSEDSLEKLLRFLASSALTKIPVNRSPRYNDTSLYHHLKLTAAIANCAYREHQHGQDLQSYRLALVSGDADQIAAYVNQSLRIRDLRGRSARITSGSAAAAGVFRQAVGAECVLYEGGGGFLALAPPSQAPKLAEMAEAAFKSATEGRCMMTTSYEVADGEQLKDSFGDIWEQAIACMREKKLAHAQLPPSQISSAICDVCLRESAVHEGRALPTTPPRNELLCEHCFKLRTETTGTWADDIRDAKDYIAVLRMDGNRVGGLLSGKNLPSGKTMTPSRLSALSSLIRETIQVKAVRIIAKHGGEAVFAGGDDLLALLPGKEAFGAAAEVAHEYSHRMAGKAGISCGIAFARHKSPVYSALEASKELLDKAKSVKSSDAASGAVAFVIAPAEGISSSTLENQTVHSWADFEGILNLARSFEGSHSTLQLRHAVTAVKEASRTKDSPLDGGRAFVKHQMARNRIPWSEGVRLMKEIENGTLVEAYSIYNTFMSDRNVNK